MGKSTNKSNSKNSSKSRNKSTTSGKLNSPIPGRPKHMIPSAGVTVNRRRYEKGGNWCW